MIKIAPSLLSCDFSRFGEEVARMDRSGADLIHLDVMDGHFVPNITFGAPVIKSLRSYTKKVLDVHLMISKPLEFIDDFAKAGADIITFNLEADSPIPQTIEAIRAAGCCPALCVKPATPVEQLFDYLDAPVTRVCGLDGRTRVRRAALYTRNTRKIASAAPRMRPTRA